MADGYPTRLDAFCRRFNIDFFSLQLHCVFCHKPCSLEDLAGFFTKELGLIWKGDYCFASCKECVYKAAELEFVHYYRGSVNAVDIERATGISLQCILCRCSVCLKVLTNTEKIACIGRGVNLHLVRNTWRGLCTDCINLP